MSNIVLVYPKTGMDIASTVAPPHALLSIAAPLQRKGYSVKIIDMRVEPNWKLKLSHELTCHPMWMGITAMTGTQIRFAIEVAEFVRSFETSLARIVWGGPHPTLLYEQTLRSGLADYVCIGEAEETVLELTEHMKGLRSPHSVKGIAFLVGNELVKTEPRPLVDVETLLSTPWDLIDVEKYIHPDIYIKNSPRTLDIGQTSRGCPMSCNFCSSASIRQRKWRGMSAGKSLDLITDAVKRFHLSGIWIRDDEFYISQQRAAQIAEGMLGLGIRWYTSGTRVDVFNRTPDEQVELYARSGANVLKMGAEAGNNRILKLMNKGITKEETITANLKIKRHNITPAYALMMGFPSETFAEINDTIELANRLKRDNPRAQFETMATYTALPGTPMWQMAVDYGLKPPQNLAEWADWNFDEYDLEGRRIPWFNAKDRMAIGNLCYLSMLSNAMPNVIEALDHNIAGRILRAGYALPHKYFQARFRHKMYRNMPELMAIRWMRNKMFYHSHMVVR